MIAPLPDYMAPLREQMDMYDTGQGIPVVANPSPERLAILEQVRAMVSGRIPVDATKLAEPGRPRQ